MTDVVTVLLTDKDKLLLLKRSDKVRTYKGKWAGISGYVEPDKQALETAYKELKEEVDLDRSDVELLLEAQPLSFSHEEDSTLHHWKVHPFIFLFKKKAKIQIDWEHTEYTWIRPHNIDTYDTVPRLKDIVHNLFE